MYAQKEEGMVHMRAGIVYYSFSGNTKSASLYLCDMLTARGMAAEIIALKPNNEITSFFKQGRQAFRKEMPELVAVNKDLSAFDFICFASPVWAFTFAPALRSYLHVVSGIEHKKTACFLTYGSGLGKGNALQELTEIVQNKKTEVLFSKDFPGRYACNCQYLEKFFQPLIDNF